MHDEKSLNWEHYERREQQFFTYQSMNFDLFCALKSMLSIKIDLFTSYISKVFKFNQLCLLCIKKGKKKSMKRQWKKKILMQNSNGTFLLNFKDCECILKIVIFVHREDLNVWKAKNWLRERLITPLNEGNIYQRKVICKWAKNDRV